jgi:hypothetical protein
MKTYEGSEGISPTFLVSALDGAVIFTALSLVTTERKLGVL